MSADVHIYYGTVKRIMRGDDVSDIIETKTRQVAARANTMARENGWGMDVDPYGYRVKDGQGKVVARNIPNSNDAANAENAKHNTLKKALGV